MSRPAALKALHTGHRLAKAALSTRPRRYRQHRLVSAVLAKMTSLAAYVATHLSEHQWGCFPVVCAPRLCLPPITTQVPPLVAHEADHMLQIHGWPAHQGAQLGCHLFLGPPDPRQASAVAVPAVLPAHHAHLCGRSAVRVGTIAGDVSGLEAMKTKRIRAPTSLVTELPADVAWALLQWLRTVARLVPSPAAVEAALVVLPVLIKVSRRSQQPLHHDVIVSLCNGIP